MDDQELLRELEALVQQGSGEKDPTGGLDDGIGDGGLEDGLGDDVYDGLGDVALMEAGGMAPIRQGDEDINDFGAEHVELAEEDLPDLLQELSLLDSESREDNKKEEKTVTVESDHKGVPVETGDAMESALPALPDVKEMSAEQLLALIKREKVQAVMCKRAGDETGMHRSFQLYKAAQARLEQMGPITERMAATEVIKALEKQIQVARQAQKRPWEQAMESDLVALKGLALKNPRGTLPIAREKVRIPLLQSQPAIPKGEMHVRVGGLLPKREGTAIPPELGKYDHFYRIILDTPLTAATCFRAREWKETKEALFAIPIGATGTLKTIKYFEHHRLKIELVRRETLLLGLKSKEVTVGSGSIKLAPLLTQSSLSSTVDLGGGLQVALQIDLREPIKGATAAAQHREEVWCFPAKGVAIKQFQPEETKLVSYVVIEWEMEQCQGDPKRRAALEAQGQTLQRAVEEGRLSLPQYLEQVKEAIAQCKRNALEAKRAGKMEECKRLLKHLQLMEEEVAEAIDQ